MDIRTLQQIDKAPQSGYMLLYTRQDVIFEKYDFPNIDSIKEYILSKLNNKAHNEVLEVHLFDSDKEYRAIKTNSHRIYQNSAKGAIECVVSKDEVKALNAQSDNDKLNKVDTYIENILLDSHFNKISDKITVINYIEYDDNGMGEMYNYRLMIKENYGGENNEQ